MSMGSSDVNGLLCAPFGTGAALPDLRGTEVMSLLFRGCFEQGLDGGYLLRVSVCKRYLLPLERPYPIVLINHDQQQCARLE